VVNVTMRLSVVCPSVSLSVSYSFFKLVVSFFLSFIERYGTYCNVTYQDPACVVASVHFHSSITRKYITHFISFNFTQVIKIDLE